MGSNERAMFGMELKAVKWEELYHLRSCAEQFEFFQDTVMCLVEKHFPYKSVSRHSNDRPWVTDTFRYLIRRRQRAYYSRSTDKETYNFYRNRVNRMGEKLQSVFYKNKVADLKTSKPGMWWKGVKQLMGDTKASSSGPLQDLANKVCDGNMQDLADKINTFFASLCQNMPPLPVTTTIENNDVIPDKYIIDVDKVEYQLAHLRPNKAPGPDLIPTWILRDFSPILAGPVAAIWNSSVREGFLPMIWKSAFLSPLPKKTPPESVEKDIRPISLTPILCKELETYPVKWLWESVTHLIDPKQFGTVRGSSTVHALVELLHHCYHATDGSKSYARLLLLDYTKAFDMINHRILLEKLHQMNVPPFLLKWISAFLNQRQQQVKIGSTTSAWATLKGGVPQGTKLGPVLFIIMINDLTTTCPSFKYVDDTTLLHISNDPKAPDLQISANEAVEWSKQNDMCINPSKTKDLLIDFCRSVRTRDEFPAVSVDGEVIESVGEAKMLGVILSHDLKWNAHVDSITSKAGKRLFMLTLLKKAAVPKDDIVAIYKSKVRSLLEYACEAWQPGLTDYLESDIERIQKRALKIIFPTKSYENALADCKLDTLRDRREKACSKFVTKMMKPTHKLSRLIPNERPNTYNLRHSRCYETPKLSTVRAEGSLVNWFLTRQ